MLKKIALVAILIVVFGLIYSLGKQIYESLQVNSRLDQEVGDLVKLQQKNAELKKKLSQTGTLSYIESQARDKLNFSREGETVVIIPESEINKMLTKQEVKFEEKLPNWQGWARLFWK